MFVSRIKEIRMRLGISQKELGKRAGGISQVQISFIERDLSGTRYSTIENIAKALGIYAYNLFEYKCEDFTKCTNPDKKQYDCYVKGKCEKYKELLNYTSHILVFAGAIFLISKLNMSLCRQILAYISFYSPL